MLRDLGIKSGVTNKVERLHGTLKDKLKPLRGLKNPETAKVILNGWVAHYNLIRPHLTLNRKPPANLTLTSSYHKTWKQLLDEITRIDMKN